MPNMDIYLLVQEFYAMEAVSAMLGRAEYGDFQPIRHSHDRWRRDFQEFRDHYTSQLAAAIYDYTVLAVAAEMRHARRLPPISYRITFRELMGGMEFIRTASSMLRRTCSWQGSGCSIPGE